MYKRCTDTYIYNVCISYLYLQWPYIYIYIVFDIIYIYTAWVTYVLYTLDMLYSYVCDLNNYVYIWHMYIFLYQLYPVYSLHINLFIELFFLFNVMLRLGIVWEKTSTNDLSGHLWRMGRVCSRRQGAKRVNRLTVWPWIRIHLTRLLGVDVCCFSPRNVRFGPKYIWKQSEKTKHEEKWYIVNVFV